MLLILQTTDPRPLYLSTKPSAHPLERRRTHEPVVLGFVWTVTDAPTGWLRFECIGSFSDKTLTEVKAVLYFRAKLRDLNLSSSFVFYINAVCQERQ